MCVREVNINVNARDFKTPAELFLSNCTQTKDASAPNKIKDAQSSIGQLSLFASATLDSDQRVLSTPASGTGESAFEEARARAFLKSHGRERF